MNSFVCCFCSLAISGERPVEITVDLGEGETQGLWAHGACLANRLHSSAPTLLQRPLFPVPRLSRELELEWAAPLSKHFGQDLANFLASPDRFMQFPSESVRIELMDGSAVEFKCAFALVSENLRAICVFTEHCGHHVFPYHEAKVYQGGRLTYANDA